MQVTVAGPATRKTSSESRIPKQRLSFFNLGLHTKGSAFAWVTQEEARIGKGVI
jgi:hypothetical protein